jgi:hypothetical protein
MLLNRPRILIAHDHTFIADLCKRLLETEFEVIDTVSDGRAMGPSGRGVETDLVIVDISNLFTSKVWIYDFRANEHFTLTNNLLRHEDLDEFVALLQALGTGTNENRRSPSTPSPMRN